MTSVTLGELDRAYAAYRKAVKKFPNRPARAVLEVLKSFEKDRRLTVSGRRRKGVSVRKRLPVSSKEGPHQDGSGPCAWCVWDCFNQRYNCGS